MKRSVALVLCAALACGSCSSMVRHPVLSAGTVGLALGFGTCEVDEGPIGSCAAIGGGAAVFLGGIAALVMLIAPTPAPVVDGEVLDPDEIEQLRRKPRPRHADAGVDAAIDAAIDAAPAPDAAPQPSP
jgi:hypothetical protein